MVKRRSQVMRITGTSPMVKECNVNLVKWFLLDHGAATKPEIAQLTGISLMTVGKIVNEMCEQGALTRLGTQESALGRKAEQFALSHDSQIIARKQFERGAIRCEIQAATRFTKLVSAFSVQRFSAAVRSRLQHNAHSLHSVIIHPCFYRAKSGIPNFNLFHYNT